MSVSIARIISPIIIAVLRVSARPDCMAAAKAFRAQTVLIGLEVCARQRLSIEHGLAIARRPAIMGRTEIAAMGFVRHTIGISRADLTRDCLQQLRLWPGCETVEGLAVLGDLRGKFTVHVVEYGMAKKHLADRGLRCIQREKQRRYHLKME
jgi:hypothetical protein